MDTSIFKYGELPEFKKFTPENIRKEFPDVIKKIRKDFENIEIELVINATKDFIRPIKKFTERAKKTVFDESCLAI